METPVRLSFYAQGLKNEALLRYKEKIKPIYNVDPYLLTKNNSSVMANRAWYPKVCFGDIYVYFILKKYIF
jgi:hypothetical protein